MTIPTIGRICRNCKGAFKCTPTQIKNSQGIYCSHRCRNIGRTKPLEVRFWKYVKKSGGCWLWTGGVNEHGYGTLNVNRRPTGAHRISYKLHYGDTPEGNPHVLHRCDNPPCVRPDHLFAGNAQINAADKVAKRRQCKGSNRPLAKLTETAVVELRDLYHNQGWSQSALAAKYQVDQSAISRAVTRDTWKHLD